MFKSRFRETGFWTDDFNQCLIINQNHHIVGSIWSMKAIPYFNALEIGYIIYDKTNYGKGYMTEALELFVDYLFKVKTINRLEIRILPSHLASEKVAIKCGFTFEGLIKEALFHHGIHQDLRQFVLLRKQWLLKRQSKN